MSYNNTALRQPGAREHMKPPAPDPRAEYSGPKKAATERSPRRVPAYLRPEEKAPFPESLEGMCALKQARLLADRNDARATDNTR